MEDTFLWSAVTVHRALHGLLNAIAEPIFNALTKLTKGNRQ